MTNESESKASPRHSPKITPEEIAEHITKEQREELKRKLQVMITSIPGDACLQPDSFYQIISRLLAELDRRDRLEKSAKGVLDESYAREKVLRAALEKTETILLYFRSRTTNFDQREKITNWIVGTREALEAVRGMEDKV